MKKKEIIKKYGENILNEISEAGYLDGITISVDKNGDVDIPEGDIILAIRAHNGKRIHHGDWD